MGKDREMKAPLYPDIHVRTASPNPLALVALIRQAMRSARLERGEVERFSSEVLASDDPGRQRRICEDWVNVG